MASTLDETIDVTATRRVLITGGTGGLGAATAKAFARSGSRVVICGRDAARCAAVAAALREQTGGQIWGMALDLAQPAQVGAVVDAAARQLDSLDVVVSAAGAPADGRFETISPEAWQHSYAVKFFGAVEVIRSALPHIRRAGGGAIIALSGLFGREPMPGNIVSGSINAALENFMKALAGEVAPDRIRALTIAPGPFETQRIRDILTRRAQDSGRHYDEVLAADIAAVPLGRFGDADEFGRFVTVLVSRACDYLTGTTITLDGGLRRSV
ncbi:MAG: SDR family oxidoreductase [Lautropia sp.]